MLSSKLSNTVDGAAQIQKRTDQGKETVKHRGDEGATKRSGGSARDSEDDPAGPHAVDDALQWLDREIAAARLTQTAKDQPAVAVEAVDELPEPSQTVASPARHTSDNQTVSPPLADATTQANSSVSSPLSAFDDASLAGNDNVHVGSPNGAAAALDEADKDQRSIANVDRNDEEHMKNGNTTQKRTANEFEPVQSGSRQKLVKRAGETAAPTTSGKRKVDRQEAGAIYRESPKKQKLLDRKIATLFKETIPEASMQPRFIYQVFADRIQSSGQGANDDRALLMTRLLFGIAIPDAFCQLRDVCCSIRQDRGPLPQSTDNLAETIKALDKLDTTVNMTSILRRNYLVSLASRRA